MELIPLAGITCGSFACPTVYTTDGDDLIVQGYVSPVQRGADEVPEGETRVRIPRQLLIDAAKWLPAVDR
ncbi:hypothetical protein [Parafrankia sp. EUN1f]|uniref:hypothetical protein n=1 Tax=Parafrankia sp. EUN1f TaxID=102897 RepID=UPI0001C46CC1|nr:hypothetical protein [Parafrankia sp. EUN1f]EFC80336.1 hypothetical protein FrEUN1fDRAFT_6531 [Parafrankia sp. EUN1f]